MPCCVSAALNPARMISVSMEEEVSFQFLKQVCSLPFPLNRKRQLTGFQHMPLYKQPQYKNHQAYRKTFSDVQ